MKKITKLSVVVLSGLLMLLGFGGCKSAKKAAKDAEQTAKDSSITRFNGRPIQIRPNDPRRIRVLYGPPPAQYRVSRDAAK